MNNNKKGFVIASIFVVVLAIIFGGIGYIIYNSPARTISTTGGNYTANLMNDGKLLKDNEYMYYSNGDGVWCIKEDDTEKEQISKTGGSFLQTDAGGYFWTDNDKLIGSTIFGQNQKVILDYAKEPYIVGDRIYYLDRDGYLNKYMSWNGEIRKINIKPAGQFIVYAAQIYYVASDGYIHRCALDGSEDSQIKDLRAEKFSIDGQLIYALNDGKISIASISGENTDVKMLCKADMFAVNNGWVVYNANGKCWLGEINRLFTEEGYKPEQLLDHNADNIQIAPDNFYVFDGKAIHRLPFEVGKLQDFIK